MPVNSVTRSLIDAVHQGDAATVADYMKAGVDPDSRDSVGRTPLYHAAFKGDAAIAKLLLDRHADANAEDDTGETPFICALGAGHFDIAEMLLEAGADINLVSGEQRQPVLHWAFNMDLREEKQSRVLWLLEKGADASRINGNGRTVMDRARGYEERSTYVANLLGAIEEFIRTHDPAYIRAREIEAAQEEMCAAIHGGLRQDLAVKPLRLVPAPKKL